MRRLNGWKTQRAARLAAGNIEHVSVPKASNLPAASLSVASETASVRPLWTTLPSQTTSPVLGVIGRVRFTLNSAVV
jgi:hypothetical protein